MRRDAGGVRRVQGRRVLLRTRGRSYSPTAGLHFDDAELESKLVWIWGSPRSGSTWLLELFCHPLRVNDTRPLGFGWPDGWQGRAHALPVDEFLISRHLMPTDGPTTEIGGEPRFPTLSLMMEMHGAKPGYSFSREFADVWRPEMRRLTLVRLHAVIERARQAGVELEDPLPLVAIKEVNGSYGAEQVMSLFPRSKMIFLVRDGRDTLDSLIDAYSPGSWLDARIIKNPAREDRLAWITELCRQWVVSIDACESAFEAHDPSLRRMVRYEELLADTPTILGDLVGWIGLPSGPRRLETVASTHSFERVPDELKGEGRFYRSATPGRWREGLTPDEQRVAHEVMGTRLVRLGYEE